MLTSSISFVNFKKKIKYTKVKKNLKLIIDNKSQNQVIKSLSKSYKYSFKKKKLDKYRKLSNFRVIDLPIPLLQPVTTVVITSIYLAINFNLILRYEIFRWKNIFRN